MSLWWCSGCDALVPGDVPGICGMCGGHTTMATFRETRPIQLPYRYLPSPSVQLVDREKPKRS